ncbi:MAG: beta strand repeat-containing protein [Promethearchaeota archaeon]
MIKILYKKIYKITSIAIICLLAFSTVSQFIEIPKSQSNFNYSPNLSAPTITIYAPTTNEFFGSTAPNFSVYITDASSTVNVTWYTIDGGTTNYTFVTNGTINQGAWNGESDGVVTITFYANNTLGDESTNYVDVQKDATPPSIDSIVSPSSGAWFNASAPSYSLSITESNVDTIWYTLDNGVNNYTGASSGTINSTAWTNAGEGPVTIIFYVNDSAGNMDSAMVGINKDSIDPLITSINSPSSGVWFGSSPPSYSLSITESNVDTIWYTLDNGANNYTGAASGTINSTAWTNAGQGPVTIIFYVNDSAGNLDTDSVGINKDSINPILTSINSPSSGAWFNASAPSYSLSITEANVDTIWYTLDNGANNYTGASTGTINSTAWTNAGEGPVTIIFYVNDSAGNLDFDSLGINKDSIDPIITSIGSPSSGAWFGSSPPSYSLSITESNVDTIWYTLDNGANNYTGASTGTINSTAWTNAGEGPVTIVFYVNDSAGNLDFDSVGINKDSIDPIITSVDSPSSGAWFNTSSPSYSLSITEANIDTIWYTLDNGVNNYTGASTGTINSTAWTNTGEGPVTIIFYVNDSASNLDTASVVINKDTIAPSIDSIGSPSSGAWFGSSPPSYSLSITETNIDTIWYTLDNGVNNYTGASTGTINSTVWTNTGEGPVTIIFYVNDSAGYSDSASVNINKDSIDPIITSIDSPSSGAWFNASAPSYSLSITESNVDTIWYTLDNGANNYTGASTGTINSTAWTNAGEGPVTIIFYVNDSAGNFDTDSLGINKDSIDPIITSIDSPSSGAWFNASAPSYSLSITEANIDTIWYTLDNGANNYTGASTGTINSTAWTNAGEGPVTIIFYVNDSAGNFDTDSLGINKDSIDPIITSIDSPSSGAWFNASAPSYSLSITEANVDTIWYTLDNGVNNYTGASTGTINSTAWTNAGEGPVTIIFYVNDSAGNKDSDSVGINKDSLKPTITINSPNENDQFSTPPNYNITIIEPNPDSIWYTLDAGLNNYTGALTGTINSTPWTAASIGFITITFYANDTLGHWNFTQVTVEKTDVLQISINSPSMNEWFSDTPNYTVSINGPNRDSVWYTLDNGANNYTVTSSAGATTTLLGTINSTAWTNEGDGAVIIIFYLNDTSGTTLSDSVQVNKDTIDPIISSINSPSTGAWFGSSPPSYNLSITESNVDTIWYTLDDGANNYTGALTGNIFSTAWTNAGEGPVTIIFYVNDSAGNLDSASVGINKDSFDPIITNIDSPSSGAWFGSSPPSYSLSITEANIDTIWYTLDNGANNYTGASTGTINSTAWTNAGEGPVTIIFYVNDSAGNLDSASVSVNKETIPPSIDNINAPSSGVWFGGSPPSYNLSITEVNIDTIWYTLDNGANNYTGTLTGTINSTAWTNAGEGPVTIIFYVNDSAGNLDSASVGINKDSIDPIITSINSPSSGVWFGSSPPIYNLSITELNVDTIWYTLDSGMNNYTGALTGTINSTAWDNAGQGVITILFYINDSAGNLDSASVSINRDSVNPSIIIISPSGGQVFNNTAPSYSVEINDINLDAMWYTIDNGITNTSFITNGTINQNNWTAHLEGFVTLIFYANDTLGNIGSSQIVITKDILEPLITINSPTANQTIGSSAPSFSLTIVEYSLVQTWYSLYNGTHWTENVTFLNPSGVINQALWDAMPEGIIIIKFFANDSFGRIGYANVTVLKQSVEPSNLLDFLLSPLGLITMSIIGASTVAIILVVIKKRKGYKSKSKEIKRIEDIRRKSKEESKY